MGGQGFGSSGVPQFSEPPIREAIGRDLAMPVPAEPVAIPLPAIPLPIGGAAMVPAAGADVCAIANGERATSVAARIRDRMEHSLNG